MFHIRIIPDSSIHFKGASAAWILVRPTRGQASQTSFVLAMRLPFAWLSVKRIAGHAQAISSDSRRKYCLLLPFWVDQFRGILTRIAVQDSPYMLQSPEGTASSGLAHKLCAITTLSSLV